MDKSNALAWARQYIAVPDAMYREYVEELLRMAERAESNSLAPDILRVVPYVVATLAPHNSIAISGNKDWRGVHSGRADSCIRQLEALAKLAELDGEAAR